MTQTQGQLARLGELPRLVCRDRRLDVAAFSLPRIALTLFNVDRKREQLCPPLLGMRPRRTAVGVERE